MQTLHKFLVPLFLVTLLPSMARAEPVIVPEGVADAVVGEGTGLCAATAISTNPPVDFGLSNPSNSMAAISAFIDDHAADRTEGVIRTVLDLSNNNSAGLAQSYGDFLDAALPDCQSGGCDFPVVNDATTSFASRIRGFLNVTPDLANKPIHFGFYVDDVLGFTVYDKSAKAYPVVVRPAEVGFPVWRVTNEVTFSTPGLYPIEILYAEIAEHAALEMSYFVGEFTDFAQPANQLPVVALDDAAFKLFPPTSFFQTLNGNASHPDLSDCKQCGREFINMPSDNGCDAGYYCNESALCAPCDTARLCGPTCAPCGGDTPFCVNLDGNVQCAGCRTDTDCGEGLNCNPTTKICEGSSSMSSAGGVGGAGGGTGGTGGNGGSMEGGCDCRMESTSSRAGSAGFLGIAIAAMGLMRSRRRTSRR